MTIAWGSALSKAHFDADTDDPSQARAELEAMVDRLNTKLANKTLLDSTDILDEDDFASDSAEDAPSQQSTKVYVDARSKVVGEVFAIMTHITGAVEPDNSGDSGAKFIKLTAGETGTGEYNEGLLTSESVSGTSPEVTATAVINHADSPMDGQTVHLINTEERFLRAGNSGVTQDSQDNSVDAFLTNHESSLTTEGSTSIPTDGSWSSKRMTGNWDTGGAESYIQMKKQGNNEVRARNIGTTYYMRIA